MKFIRNAGVDRTIDLVSPWLKTNYEMDMATSSLSLFAFAELLIELPTLSKARLILPRADNDLLLLGTENDRAARNRLQSRWLAKQLAEWIQNKVELRTVPGTVPQGAVVLRDANSQPKQAVLGSFSFSTEGLGISPSNPLNLIQASETTEECAQLSQWFDTQWSTLKNQPEIKTA